MMTKQREVLSKNYKSLLYASAIHYNNIQESAEVALLRKNIKMFVLIFNVLF